MSKRQKKEEYKQLKIRAEANPILHTRVAALELELGKAKRARQRLEKMIELRPNTASAHHLLARANAQLRNEVASLAQYEEALRLDPLNRKARIEYIDLLHKHGNDDKALEQSVVLFTQSPFDDEVANRLKHYQLSEIRKRTDKKATWNPDWHPFDFTENGALARAAAHKLHLAPKRPELPEGFEPDYSEEELENMVSNLPMGSVYTEEEAEYEVEEKPAGRWTEDDLEAQMRAMEMAEASAQLEDQEEIEEVTEEDTETEVAEEVQVAPEDWESEVIDVLETETRVSDECRETELLDRDEVESQYEEKQDKSDLQELIDKIDQEMPAPGQQSEVDEATLHYGDDVDRELEEEAWREEMEEEEDYEVHVEPPAYETESIEEKPERTEHDIEEEEVSEGELAEDEQAGEEDFDREEATAGIDSPPFVEPEKQEPDVERYTPPPASEVTSTRETFAPEAEPERKPIRKPQVGRPAEHAEDETRPEEYRGPVSKTLVKLQIAQGKINHAEAMLQRLRSKSPDDPELSDLQQQIDGAKS